MYVELLLAMAGFVRVIGDWVGLPVCGEPLTCIGEWEGLNPASGDSVSPCVVARSSSERERCLGVSVASSSAVLLYATGPSSGPK